MSKLTEIEKIFKQKLDEGGVVSWCKKRKQYNIYIRRMKVYEGKMRYLLHSRLAKSDYEMFEKLLERLKGAIYDIELEEKEYYFQEGIRIKKEFLG